MIVRTGQGLIGRLECMQCRHDIHHTGGNQPVRVVEGKAVSDSPAAVMPGNVKTLMSQGAHYLSDVKCHHTLGVTRMVWLAIRFGTVPVTSQIRDDQAVAGCERGRDAVPHDASLWIPMQ